METYHSVTHCVNSDIAFLWEWSKFDPHKIQTS